MDYPDGATPLDPDEMEGLRHPHVQTRGELDVLEQENIQQGLRWLDRRRKMKGEQVLTNAFVRELHARMFGDVWSWAGRYRLTEKNIAIDPLYIAVELRKFLDDAAFWVDQGVYGRVEFAATFHHRLVQIHPFPNGNGRLARIMTDVVLSELMGEQPVDWGTNALNDNGQHRDRYIKALRKADGGDFSHLIGFVSDG